MGYEFAQVRWRITTTTTFVSLRASNWDCLFVFFNGGSTNYLFLLKIKSAFRCCLLSSSSEYKYTLLELWNHTRVKVCYFFSRLNGTSSSRYFIIVLLSFHWLMLLERMNLFHLISIYSAFSSVYCNPDQPSTCILRYCSLYSDLELYRS